LVRRGILQKIGAVSGVVTPVLAFTCILIAVYSYPPFSWTNDALSDLGIVSGVTGPLFNFGLIGGGFFAFCFAVFGLFLYLGERWVGKIGVVVFAATGVSLMCIGFFPENVVPHHYLFSVAFFLLLPISLLIITGAFALKRQTKMALFTFLIAVAAALPWVLYALIRYVSGVAVPEAVSGLAGGVWAVVLGYKMFKAAPQPKMA
jgi:hypothetical membrane protein